MLLDELYSVIVDWNMVVCEGMNGLLLHGDTSTLSCQQLKFDCFHSLLVHGTFTKVIMAVVKKITPQAQEKVTESSMM